jgi:hypothetical protein
MISIRCAPVAKNSMTRQRGGIFADGDNQFAPTQSFQRALDGTLRKTCHFDERAQTRRNGFPSVSCSLSIKTKINQIGGWLAVVGNEIAHKNVDDVIVDRNLFPESGHNVSHSEAATVCSYTDKRTALSFNGCVSLLDANAEPDLASVHHDQANQIRQYSRG